MYLQKQFILQVLIFGLERDVRTSSLSQVGELAYHRPVVEIKIKQAFILECMESK
jgi:hypothetical protein